jgi:flavin-dependent dehydrogenase
MKVDIIGGGIAGLSAAISLIKHSSSITVIVHDKNNKIGYNHDGRKCGEAHSVIDIWKKWTLEKGSYFNEITKGEVIVGNKKRVYERAPGIGFILNRHEFICQLGREASKLGVIVNTNDKIRSIRQLDGDYIIDASGCPSVVKRELGIGRGVIGIGYQQTLEDSNFFIPDTIMAEFTGFDGYYWIFPRNPVKKEINIGIGFTRLTNFKLKPLLENYKKINKIEGKVNHSTGGLIPIGLQRPFKYKNILFVGDTGVGTFPFSGQGIYRALVSGDIAGKCIATDKLCYFGFLILFSEFLFLL